MPGLPIPSSPSPPVRRIFTPATNPVIGVIRPKRRLAILVWLALAGIWGSAWLAIKVGLRDLPPITFAGIRFALAAALLGGIVLARRIRLPRSTREWGLLAYT